MARKLYIIHGWAYTVEPWQEMLEVLRRNEIEPVMLHVPGLTSPSSEVWDIDSYCYWLDKQLEGESKPVVFGHSNGGRILMNYAIKYPQKLKHIILLNSAGVYEDEKSIKNRRLLLRFLANLCKRVCRPLTRISILRKIVYKLLGASDYENAPPNMKKTLQNMLNSDYSLRPEQIKTPSSILWGESDMLTPIDQGQRLHELIKGSTFKSFSGWRHAPYKTHPHELAREIISIVEGIK